MREPGFYWVKKDGVWLVAHWEIHPASPGVEPMAEWHVDAEYSYGDHDWEQIGPRLTPPEENPAAEVLAFLDRLILALDNPATLVRVCDDGGGHFDVMDSAEGSRLQREAEGLRDKLRATEP